MSVIAKITDKSVTFQLKVVKYRIVFVLNDSFTYSHAELFLPKNNLQINKILHCLNYNSITHNCTSWDVKLPSYYNIQENSTHIWFNVTEFTGYVGGIGYNSNLTIWDDTESQTKYTGQQIKFYANYTNVTTPM